jgi:hypothetical protein
VDDHFVRAPAVGPLGQHQRDQYLAFGFVPELPAGADPLALLRDWSRGPRRSESSVSEAVLVREGARALRAAFEECAATAPTGADQVVFLSGGLDSRAILGGLLDLYRPGEIRTATFGAPGEQDFDVAAGVARVAGVRHEVVESASVEWTTEGLVDSVLAREVPLPHPFGQRYLSYRLHQQVGAGHVFWDGLCGGVVSGGHVPGPEERGDWDEAVADFAAKHLLTGWEQVTSPGFDPVAALPAAPFLSGSLLPYPDQLDFALRQNRYIRTRHLRGYTMQSPFLARPWVDFMLALPIRYRNEQRLYMTVLRRAYPRLFSLPTTTFDGAAVPASPLLRRPLVLQRRVLRRVQRTGWLPGAKGKPDSNANNAIRRGHLHRADLRELMAGNLTDLADRGIVPGLDPAEVTRVMADRSRNALLVDGLLGLELNLKAVDRLARDGSGNP